VIISCNLQQFDLIPDTFTKVLDAGEYYGAGPMTGLLSTIHLYPGHSLLVLGCDYPFMDEAILRTLLQARDDNHDAISIYNQTTGFYEPLLSIYEERCFNFLKEFYATKNTSLQQFLKAIQTKKVITEELYKIQSIDTKEEYNRIITVTHAANEGRL
jgi:molybdopterin-guanine dinucleotide biosynthesis protein A